MGCALFSMSKTQTLSYALPIWVALLFPFVNGSLITSNAGNCSSNEFWYAPIRDCVPLGKRSFESVSPHGVACPSNENWYWSSQLSVCLPASPVPDVSSLGSMSCPSHYTWDATTSRCIQVGKTVQPATACGTTEFWFPEKATCLARRTTSPPSTRCPSGWYWSAQLTSCAPASPEARALSSLTCGDDSIWSPSTLMCQRAATPSRRSPSKPSPSSGQLSRRHSLKSRSLSLCPTGLDACPILMAGDLSDYECVDPLYDLQHCGGCSLDGRGEDCTAIQGVWNVECIRARCSVMTCMAGYVPSINRRICVKL